MTIDQRAGLPAGGAYGGFSRAAPAPEPRRPGRLRAIVMGGVAAALALGLGAGLLARPDLAETTQQPMAAARQIPTSAQDQLAIVVNHPAPAPIPRSSDKLEVLPARLAAAAPSPVVVKARASEGDEAVGADDADEAPPIDCAAPANGHEARICDDIGFGPAEDRDGR